MARPRSLWPAFLIFSIALATAQTATHSDNTQVLTDEDYAVISAAFSDFVGKTEQVQIVLLDQTATGFPPGMAAVTRFGEKTQNFLKDVSEHTRQAFDSHNKNRVKIESAKIKGSFEIMLLSDDAVKTLVEGSKGWQAFHDKYPKASGITLVSRPGLNSDGTRALLYMGTSCDMRCGDGIFILLGRENGQWKVLKKETIWVS
jgi:hypothetical protein